VHSHTKVLSIVVKNPMAPQEALLAEHEPGCKVSDLVPDSPFPQICRLDGLWLLRAGWDRELAAGQVVEFYTYPQGGGDGGSNPLRAILMIAALYVAIQFGQPWLFQAAGGTLSATGTVLTTGAISYGAAGSIAVLAASSLVNALVPVSTGDNAMSANSVTGSTAYSATLAGNQARLELPIPDMYGRNKVFPDFACEPYVTYQRNQEDDNDDQYYHVVFCVGQGHYLFENKLIDDAPLGNFQDVEVRELPPGVQPTLVLANVVNASEVTGNEIQQGRYAGPFMACKPRLKAYSVGIDIGFSRGLAAYDAAGNPGNETVTWRVEYRVVNDFGQGLSTWETLAEESLTAAETKPIRRSYIYDLPVRPGFSGPLPEGYRDSYRPQIRLVRTSPFNDNSRVANTIEWIGLKAYLSSEATLCPTATHMELRMRANEQLSSLSQRKFAVIVRRLVRTWHPDTGWSGLVETRNPAWALANKWTDAVYGDGYEDSRCDLLSLYNLSLIWEARQDRFDGVFAQTYASLEADQMIAQSGRASVFRRNGVMTAVRDQLRDMPVTAFTARNIQPGTVSIDYALATDNTPDGVIVEYWDNRAWDWYDILCPAPGVTDPVRPQRLRLFGVTGSIHARREGLYHAANSFYRRKFATFSTELEGMIPSFGSAAVFAPSFPGWGRGGDFVSYDSTTQLATVSEPPLWQTGQVHYISVILNDGSLSAPIEILPGGNDFEILLTAAPPSSISTKSPNAERTRYVFGIGRAYDSVIRILDIRNSTDDQGVRAFTISGVLEDDRVHLVDAPLLPTDGLIQNPVGDGSGLDGIPGDDGIVPPGGTPPPVGDPGSGSALVARLVGITDTWGGGSNGSPEQSFELRLVLDLDGVFRLEYIFEGGLVQALTPAGTWLLAAPWTDVETANFNVRATVMEGDIPLGDVTGSVIALGVKREWYVRAAGPFAESRTKLKIEIIKASDSRLQASAEFDLTVLGWRPPESTGG